MGVSVKCTGRTLYNHLVQKNIPLEVKYSYNKNSLTWEGSLSIFDTSYNTKGKDNKNAVLEELMNQASDVIHSKILVRKVKNL
jgi:hypothetical protein